MDSFEIGVAEGMVKVALDPYTKGTAAGLRALQELKGKNLAKITERQFNTALDRAAKKRPIYGRVLDKAPRKAQQEAAAGGAGVMASQGIDPGRWQR